MKTWMVGLGGLVLGGTLGFFVGAMPLYLVTNANGGPLRLPVESLERRLSALVDVHASRPLTPTEVAKYEVELAGGDMVIVAMSYCRMSPDLQRRARAVAAKLTPAMAAVDRKLSSAAAFDYLIRAREGGSCVAFENPDMRVVREAVQ